MSDRGRYRSITCALVNGPDYQRLSPNARLVLLTLKISLGPAGIELKYAGVLLHELHHQTGLSVRSLIVALGALEEAGWIRRGDNLLWIVRQLEFEPQVHSTNPRHVKGVRQHIQGLPRVPLVEAFKAKYGAYFTNSVAPAKAPDSLSHSLSHRLSHSPPIPLIGFSQREREREREGERDREVQIASASARAKKPRDAKPEQPSWVQTLTAAWIEKVGAVEHGRLGKALKAVVDKHGPDAVVAAITVYASNDEGPRGVRSVNYFAADFQRWHTLANTPLVDRDGVLTARGARIGSMS